MPTQLLTDRPATGTLERPNGTLAYDLHGPDGAPLVVLAPGLGDLRGEYRELAPRLAAAGWRVASVDLRGHGDSSPRWPSYTIEDVAGDLLALVDALGGAPAVLVGNSFSAGAAVWAAATRPDAVAALALVGPFVRDHDLPWYMKVAMAAMFAGPWRVRSWDAYYASLFPTRKPDDLAPHRAALRANLAEPGRFDALKAMMDHSQAATETRLPRVQAPTLVVMGSRDSDFPDPAGEAHWIAERTDGEVAMIDGAGHYPQTEFPEATADALLGFLARRVPGAPDGRGGAERVGGAGSDGVDGVRASARRAHPARRSATSRVARRSGRPSRPALTSERVVDAAVDLLEERWEEEGSSLTLAALADRLGVRTPSLYNHIGGLDELRAALKLRALEGLVAALQPAALGRSGEDALRALACAYRDWARCHPGLYALTQRSAEGGDPALQAAGRAVIDIGVAALRGYGLEGDDALHATRAVRSALHGFALLEIGGGFGLALEPDASFEALLGLLHRGLERSGVD